MGAKVFESFCEIRCDDIQQLCRDFGDYEPTAVDVSRVRRWLRQFDSEHWSLAIKLAQNLCYYDVGRVTEMMRSLHKVVIQSVGDKKNLSSALFVPLGAVGESGFDIARRYRNVNRLHQRQNQFVTILELPSRLYELEAPIVFFLEDFVGTGSQIAEYWESTLRELVPDYYPMYLLVLLACECGAKHIESESPILVSPVHTLDTRFRLISDSHPVFTKEEIEILRGYCDHIGNFPMGFGDLGLLVSFFYGTPNNTVSLIRGGRSQRRCLGLLPRYENLKDTCAPREIGTRE